MQSLMRLICLGYLVYLTALLWTADPTRLVGDEVAGFMHPFMPVAHLLSFTVLAVLALVTRWPAPRWAIVVLLAMYGGMTEIVQGFLPPRTPDWMDWLQDLAGIGVGAASCWTVALAVRALMPSRRRAEPCGCPAPAGPWEVLRNVASRSAADDQSWWR
jgi:VanZ family protein